MVKFIETESRMIVARAGRAGIGELLFNGYKASVLQNEEFYGWMMVTVEEQCKCINATELYTLKWLRWYVMCILPQKKKKKTRAATGSGLWC